MQMQACVVTNSFTFAAVTHCDSCACVEPFAPYLGTTRAAPVQLQSDPTQCLYKGLSPQYPTYLYVDKCRCVRGPTVALPWAPMLVVAAC